MLLIKKGTAPQALQDAIHRLKETPDTAAHWKYIDSATKRKVLDSLLAEQGSLCAYCMRRIAPDKAHVEHYIPQSRAVGADEGSTVDYRNMLAVCDGLEGNASGPTCDRARGNEPLHVDPQREDTLSRIRYSSNGRIRSADDDVNRDLDRTLKLNHPLLLRNRDEVVKRLAKKLANTEKRKGTSEVRKLCQHYVEDHLADPKLREEFDGIVVYFMKRHLRAAD